jgi:hypothetical protein
VFHKNHMKLTRLTLLFTILGMLFFTCTVGQTQKAEAASSIKINSPKDNTSVPIGNNSLVISGRSIDNVSTSCQVGIIINGLRPYQNATASGPGGATDYSIWSFTPGPQYGSIKEGVNTITARLNCMTGAGSKLSSRDTVHIAGVS